MRALNTSKHVALITSLIVGIVLTLMMILSPLWFQVTASTEREVPMIADDSPSASTHTTYGLPFPLGSDHRSYGCLCPPDGASTDISIFYGNILLNLGMIVVTSGLVYWVIRRRTTAYTDVSKAKTPPTHS